MTNPLDTIWHGDKLQRRSEAAMLERFLGNEAQTLVKFGREQAVVLALDAQYGEGKSWFLTRFGQQLAINHPVAFVDAWVDDANQEPLVTIMAAIEDALRPFLKSKKVKERLGALTRAALPIIGKALLGAGGKFTARYLGDQFGGEASEAITTAAKSAASTKSPQAGKDDPENETLDAGVEAVVDSVSTVVDQLGAAMLAQYRTRQTSRARFKDSLRALAASIDAATEDPRQSPIYVIIDELDRCRPSYAIALLEEIKHLFDVPGLVFVIALHGQQLTHSINAVYGEKFDSHAYLRRFFTRSYALRRLSIRELVASHFTAIEMGSARFSAPRILVHGNFTEVDPSDLTGTLLSEWNATPREAQAVIDALRLFLTHWDLTVPIELPLVLVLLLNLVRGDPVAAKLKEWSGRPERYFAFESNRHDGTGRPDKAAAYDMLDAYSNAMHTSLKDLAAHGSEGGAMGYMRAMLQDEFAKMHGNIVHNNAEPPMPSWHGYPDRVRALGRFIEHDTSDDANP